MAAIPDNQIWLHEHLSRLEKLLYVLAWGQLIETQQAAGGPRQALDQLLEEVATELNVGTG